MFKSQMEQFCLYYNPDEDVLSVLWGQISKKQEIKIFNHSEVKYNVERFA